MASTKVVLILEKIKKNKEVPLYLRIIKDRKPKYVSLGIAVLPSLWDEKNQCVKSKHPNSARINNFIQHKKAEATDVILDMVTESKYVPAKSLKMAVLGKSAGSFIKYADHYLANLEKTNRTGSTIKLKAVLSKLKAFLDKHDLQFEEITVAFLKQYEAYLLDKKKNKPNTIHSNLKVIRRIFNEAISEDLVPFEKSPFHKYKLKWDNVVKPFLTEEELEIIEKYPLVEGSMKYHHRNMYVFACYAGGIRISDLIKLKWSNFNGTNILINTQKTGSVISIKLPVKAIEILNLYKMEGQKKTDYIFPLLDNDIDPKNIKFINSRISSLTAYTNTDLKDIAKAAEIKKPMNFHTSRHTWATRALRKGMRIEYVSKLMGHASIKTTQVYAKIVNADLDKAMDVFDEIPEPPAEPTQEKKASS